jgi:hypothetical protein
MAGPNAWKHDAVGLRVGNDGGPFGPNVSNRYIHLPIILPGILDEPRSKSNHPPGSPSA